MNQDDFVCSSKHCKGRAEIFINTEFEKKHLCWRCWDKRCDRTDRQIIKAKDNLLDYLPKEN